uniref:PTHB1 platform domain-containing protein n=1 Tax=Timema poppense TaxID=170557 RepID=A0A7R9DWU9_TIMPO|nr:unnamed protein product [Timema poppensis]
MEKEGSYFVEFLVDGLFTSASNAISFQCHGRKESVVSILTAKSSQRYRLQADSLSTLSLFAFQLVERLKKHFAKIKHFVCSYTSSLPMSELFTKLDAHFNTRINSKQLQVLECLASSEHSRNKHCSTGNEHQMHQQVLVWSSRGFSHRAIKTDGGRGFTDSTLAKGILAIPQSVPICSALENFCGIRNIASEQHVELRSSRQSRDDRDRQTFSSWFNVHRPFAYRLPTELIGLLTGLVGDKFVNCDKTLEIGLEFMKNMNGGTFGTTKLKRKDRFKPLSAMNNTRQVHKQSV